MNTATAILRKEHEAILRMLDVAEEVSRRLDRGEPVAPETLAGLLEFFKLFADQCHHGKEEDLLFPALERKGMPRHGGPLAVMLAEHDQGRAFVHEMTEAAKAYPQDPAAARRWLQASAGYQALLREHIHKENDILFVMAERMLSAAEQAELAAAFERAEEEKMGRGTHERLHALMDQLAAAVFPAETRK